MFGFSIVPGGPAAARASGRRTSSSINDQRLLASTATMVVLAIAGVGPDSLAWGQIAGQVVIVVGPVRSRPASRPGSASTRRGARVAGLLPPARAAPTCCPGCCSRSTTWSSPGSLSPTQLGLYVIAFNVSSWPMNADRPGGPRRRPARPSPAWSRPSAPQRSAWSARARPLLAVAVLMGRRRWPRWPSRVVRVLYGERWSAAAAALAGLAVFGALRVVLDLVATFLIAVGVDPRGARRPGRRGWSLMVPAMMLGVRMFGLAGAGWAHVVVALVVVLPAYLCACAASASTLVGVPRAPGRSRSLVHHPGRARLLVDRLPDGADCPARPCCWAVSASPCSTPRPSHRGGSEHSITQRLGAVDLPHRTRPMNATLRHDPASISCRRARAGGRTGAARRPTAADRRIADEVSVRMAEVLDIGGLRARAAGRPVRGGVRRVLRRRRTASASATAPTPSSSRCAAPASVPATR